MLREVKYNTAVIFSKLLCFTSFRFTCLQKSCSLDLTPQMFERNPQSVSKCHNTVGNRDKPQNNHYSMLRPQTQMMPNRRASAEFAQKG